MPKARKDLLQEWENLLKAVRETERNLGCVGPYAVALSNALTHSKTYQSLRESLEDSSADASRRLEKSFAEGQEAAVKLRAFLRSVLGSQNEELRRYGMRPYRGRLRELARGRKAARA